MTPVQLAAQELLGRRKARRGLLDFILYINPEYIVSEFAQELCAALDQFFIDQQAGLRPVLVVQAPPQHGKSDIVSRYAPAFLFGQAPDLSIGGLSYSKDLATDMNRDVQRIMLSPEYHRLFPGASLSAKRAVTVDVEAKRNSDVFEIVGRKGRYVGQGVGGPLTGKRLDIGLIDDPIKNAQEALSETIKDGIWNWYITTFLTRLSKNSGQIIMATSWATDDLSGRILKINAKAKHLKFVAVNMPGEKGYDPSRREGALVPDLHPLDKLLEQKAIMSDYFWSAMYQQSPIALGGNMFKTDEFRFYDVLPKLKWRAIFGDTALKTKEQNDYSVFQCWGESMEGQAVLIDQIRGKWEAPELLTQARAFWAKHKSEGTGTLRSFNVEDKASGTGLIQTLKKEGVPILGIQRSIDKITRAMDAIPLIQSGNVLLPKNAPWLSDYLSEFAAFPKGSHDDQIDPTMDAIDNVLNQGKRDWRSML
jgi:predicted phage terminase large subunit-like protein